MPRSRHPRPSDASSPSQNPLRASARCGLLAPGKLGPFPQILSKFAKTLQKGQLVTLAGTLRYCEVEDQIEGATFKHRIAEIHAISMKRLSKIEAADDPQTEPTTNSRRLQVDETEKASSTICCQDRGWS